MTWKGESEGLTIHSSDGLSLHQILSPEIFVNFFLPYFSRLFQKTHLTMISTELGEDGQSLLLLLALHPQQLHGEEALDKEAPVLELLSHIDLCTVPLSAGQCSGFDQ